MAFFNKINSVAKTAAKNAAELASDAIGSGKIAVKIKREELLIEQQYEKIGEYFYKMRNEGMEMPSELDEYFVAIDVALATIKELQEIRDEMKDGPAVRTEADEASRKYKYILFDLDGTLTDSKEGIINCLRYAIERMGEPMPSYETMLTFIGPPLRDSFASLGYDEEKTERAIALYRERYIPIGKYENEPAPGAVALCERLKDKGYVMALASSKPQQMCIDICEKFGFSPYLDHIVGPADHSDWSKADVIREAMKRLGLTEANRSEILMVGDRMYDVHGATECGIDCIGVEFFGYAAPGELMDAGAVAVVQTAEELEEYILNH